MSSQAPHPLRNDLLLVLVTLLAAAGWMFSKRALGYLPPLLFLGIRFVIAGAILSAVGAGALRALTAVQWRQAAGMGLLFALGMMIWVLGLQHSRQVGVASFIAGMGVVLVPLCARFLFRDALPRSTWAAIPFALAGLGLLSLHPGADFEAGHWLILASAAIFALHFNLVARTGTAMSSIALTAVQLWLVGLVSGAVGLCVEPMPASIGAAAWGWIAASALLASSARFLLQNYARARVAASHAAIIMVLEPVWTSMLAAAFLDESMSLRQLAGCALIFTAMLVNRWSYVQAFFRSLGQDASAA